MSTRPVAALLVVGTLVVLATSVVLSGGVKLPFDPAASVAPRDAARLRVEYEVLPAEGVTPTVDDLRTVADIVRSRLESVGITDTSVEPDDDRIVVEVPSVTDGFALRRLVQPSGRIHLVPLGQEQANEGQIIDLQTHQPLFGGDQIEAASVGTDATGSAAVAFTLRPQAAAIFGQYTANHIGDYFAITLDGRVLTVPIIQSAIPDGDVEISIGQPNADPAEIRELFAILQYGSFPWPLREVGTGPVPTAT